MALRATVEDGSGRVIALVTVGPPDDHGLCLVEVADSSGWRYSGLFNPARGNRHWLRLLKAALRSVR